MARYYKVALITDFLIQSHIRDLNEKGLLLKYLQFVNCLKEDALTFIHENDNMVVDLAKKVGLSFDDTRNILIILKENKNVKKIKDKFIFLEPVLFEYEEQTRAEPTWQDLIDCLDDNTDKQYNDNDLPFSEDDKEL